MNRFWTYFLLLLTSLLLALPAAKADLLYFIVDSYNAAGDTSLNFDYVMVGVAKKANGEWATTWGTDGDKVYLKIQAEGGEWGDFVEAAPIANGYTGIGAAWADVSDYTADGYAFYIETYKNNSSEPIWGFSEDTALGYAALLEQGHIYTETMDQQDVTPWAIPEPTAGWLVLFGLSALALRRKRA